MDLTGELPMQRMVLLLITLLLAGASPAFAEGFSQVQFGLLIIVNLALGAILTLFGAVLVSALLKKLKSDKKIEARVMERERRA
jgi:NhaP-type Na+/H+ or K+/H+ antiporter